MPLTKKGQKVLKGFKDRYGKEGESYFYAWLNKKTEQERRQYENE